VLGYLIEKISGHSYKDFLQENIFKPLGMNNSGYDSNSAILLHRASGYSPGPDGPQHAGYIDMTIPFSAGALYSTTEDLLRWEQGLFGGKVLSDASLKKMTTPFKNDYAFGLVVRTVNGHKVIEHGGGIEGFNTQMSYFPDDKLTVIVLGNLNGGAPGAIASSLASVAHGEKVILPSERKEVAVPNEILKQYVGTYDLAPGFSIVVTLEGSQLMTQATGQRKIPIYPESETKFFLKAVDAQIEFSKNEKGEVTSMTLYQNGQTLKGAKH
jgi:CubicO group peptidase (beta-lactamase class C family)